MLNKVCHQCKKEYSAKTIRSKFCSNICKYLNFKENNPSYDKKYRDQDRKKYNMDAKINNHNWRNNNPIKLKEIQKKNNKKYQEKYPEKRKVQKNGWKKRAKWCFKCGSTKQLEFHHIDYITDVGVTLCMPCHKLISQLNNQKGGKNI